MRNKKYEIKKNWEYEEWIVLFVKKLTLLVCIDEIKYCAEVYLKFVLIVFDMNWVSFFSTKIFAKTGKSLIFCVSN